MTPINEAKHFKIKSLVGKGLLTDTEDNSLGTIQVKSGLSLIKTRIPYIFEEDDEGEIYIYRKGGCAKRRLGMPCRLLHRPPRRKKVVLLSLVLSRAKPRGDGTPIPSYYGYQ